MAGQCGAYAQIAILQMINYKILYSAPVHDSDFHEVPLRGIQWAGTDMIFKF